MPRVIRWAYLKHEAEVGGSSVFQFEVLGVIDVEFFKMDKADKIAGRLSEREKKKLIFRMSGTNLKMTK